MLVFLSTRYGLNEVLLASDYSFLYIDTSMWSCTVTRQCAIAHAHTCCIFCVLYYYLYLYIFKHHAMYHTNDHSIIAWCESLLISFLSFDAVLCHRLDVITFNLIGMFQFSPEWIQLKWSQIQLNVQMLIIFYIWISGKKANN